MAEGGLQALEGHALKPLVICNCMSRLKRLLKKSGGTATLGCAPYISAAKPAQARVPVPLKSGPFKFGPLLL